MATMGWTVDELFTPMKRTAPYMEPNTLNKLICSDLQDHSTHHCIRKWTLSTKYIPFLTSAALDIPKVLSECELVISFLPEWYNTTEYLSISSESCSANCIWRAQGILLILEQLLKRYKEARCEQCRSREEGDSLRFFPKSPKDRAKQNGSYECEEISNTVVIRAPPISPILLPKASSDLSWKWLRILCREGQILCSPGWKTQNLDELLVSPA